MTFISYAQNFEDVMLWRALKHVENGFYIDVGANDPTLFSVTRAFYDRGWHGINVEPVSQFFDRLCSERSRDINLQMGAGASAGSFPFFDIPDSGLATSDAKVAEMHRKDGWEVREIEVPVLPLAKICNRHVTGDIHFLKIDVEGAERNVLLGMDFQKWRPWIVVVEATVPMSQRTAHESWEPLLLDADYAFVYFDGLNRYYVAAEHAQLKPAFSLPPNVFDGFVLNTDQESKSRTNEAEARAHQSRQRALESEFLRKEAEARTLAAETQINAAEARAREALIRMQQAEAQMIAIYASNSWKIMAPLRTIGLLVGSPRSFAARLVRAVLRRTLPVITRSPFLFACGRRLTRAFPAVSGRILDPLRAAPPSDKANQPMAQIAVIRDDLPAWGGSISPADQFKAALSRELQQRAKNGRSA
jgi:FkbM family methyltransferase